MVDAVESMAYTSSGGVPWHGLGKAVSDDMTPKQMQRAAGADFLVDKRPCQYLLNGRTVTANREALIRINPRTRTEHELDYVTPEWKPVQNDVVFSFFKEFCVEGGMTMETAGVLQEGRMVWALAKLKESFEVFKGKDLIESYLLFTNPHQYGWSTSVSWSAIRVVCLNTLIQSLGRSSGTDKIIKVTHRNEFDPEVVKETLGLSHKRLEDYKVSAKFLASKRIKKREDVVEFFQRIFPVTVAKTTKQTHKTISKPAQECLDLLETQPGAEYGAGTAWQMYNAVTYYTDHVASKEADTRLFQAWYGTTRKKKIEALRIAMEMAKAV